MTTIKSYSDLQQSKKLAEILPLESADMEYLSIKQTGSFVGTVPFVKDDSEIENSAYSHTYNRIACWSLAALLDILSKTAYTIDEDGSVDLCDYKNIEWSLCLTNTSAGLFTANNPVDACVEVIIKLHELKLL